MRYVLAFGKLVALVVSMGLVAFDGKSQAATPEYPLKRGANPRYLVDQNDRPFLIHGDSPWSMMVQLTREETEEYLINRYRKGFNSLIVNLLEHIFCENPPLNRYGEPPFTTPGDYSTPNPAYFEHVDWVLRKAAEYGIQVFLTPSYLGYGGGFDQGFEPQGWYQEMIANGSVKLREYGRFLGQRYKDFDNIVWLNGGDYNPPDKNLVNAIAEGILEFDSNHIHTVHCGPETSALDYYPNESWLSINNTYSYVNVLGKLRDDYARNPAMPFVLLEAVYEGIAPDHPERDGSPQAMRRQAYWAIFTGACGQFFGNYPLWGFNSGWQAAMDEGGSQGMAKLRRLLDSRPWWTFVPDLNNTVVVAGFGDPNSSDPSQYYVTAARIPDGSSLWAYVPTGRTITLDMSKISGSTVQTWWYNPRTGNATAAGEFANVGLRDFTTPASEGLTQDWVLVADDASQDLPPPGTTALELTSAVSRKSHSAIPFDVPLPGVEPRRGPAHLLVFTFSNPVGSGDASVTEGTGTVSGSPVFSDKTMTVNLTNVSDGQWIRVTLNNVTDSFGLTLPSTSVTAGMLQGDTTGNGIVNATDVSQTKLHSGSAAQSENFRTDVTVSGSINGTDLSQVKLNVGRGLP